MGTKQRHSSRVISTVQRIPATGERAPVSIIPSTEKKLTAQTMPPTIFRAKIIYQRIAESMAVASAFFLSLERYFLLMASESQTAVFVLLSKYVFTLAFIIVTVPFVKFVKLVFGLKFLYLDHNCLIRKYDAEKFAVKGRIISKFGLLCLYYITVFGVCQ